ncbi:hypothetical protein BDV96DRAFT_603405 [Lophiotrema nucula]|uniref:Uncharacterized protein n=1 Tax=Lophiotrema nucula TaxID=690887 RepID=A0A6A5YW40_9PLEO|nr:hypothetical protein BDV96DRAFT_603405 [Lophiotrema nucula]
MVETHAKLGLRVYIYTPFFMGIGFLNYLFVDRPRYLDNENHEGFLVPQPQHLLSSPLSSSGTTNVEWDEEAVEVPEDFLCPGSSAGVEGIGNGRSYCVKGHPKGLSTYRSDQYPNGRNGNALYSVNSRAGYFIVDDLTTCGRPKIVSKNSGAGTFVTEHVMELQTFPAFLQFMMGRRFVFGDQASYTKPPPYVTASILERALNKKWSRGGRETPERDIWEKFGSVTNAGVLVNAEKGLNSIKALLWQSKNPISDNTWYKKKFDDTSDVRYPGLAFSAINEVTNVFDCMNNEVVNQAFATVANDVHGVLEQFSQEMKERVGKDFDFAGAWFDYIKKVLVPTLTTKADLFIDGHLNYLEETWQAKLDSTTDERLRDECDAILLEVDERRSNLNGHKIDLSRLKSG